MAALGAAAFALWLALRLGVRASPHVFTVSTAQGELPFLYLDASWLALAPAFWIWLRRPPSPRAARTCVAALTLAAALGHALHALGRYYRGEALAWDLANFVQPMWRAAGGAGMVSTWHGDRPLWGDHGSFALYLFAPLTRLFASAPTGPLLAQAALSAAFVPACFALARVLGLSTGSALAAACAAFASRPLSYAASFDFHPECALPVLLALLLWAQLRARPLLLVSCALLAASLKDMAALGAGAACLYLAAHTLSARVEPDAAPRAPASKRAALGLTGLAGLLFGVAALDMFWLPRATGWASYVVMNTSAPLDLPLALETSLMRALNTGLVGSLHPFGIFAGGPWTLAAALSPKLLVKGVQFQYGFLFVPPALLGAILAGAWLERHSARGAALFALWALLCVALNAPRPVDLTKLQRAHESFSATRARLHALAPPQQSVATDACSAPYVLERARLLPLCQIDARHFAEHGEERWDLPDPRAFEAAVILVQRGCKLHGRCLAEQVARATQRGYRVAADWDGWLALTR
jgi:hypothetical protein